MIVFNDTPFGPSEVTRLQFLGFTIDHARERTTDFFQHPDRPHRVISLRVTHDDRMCVIQDEPKWWYLQPLNRWLGGEPHVVPATRAVAQPRRVVQRASKS